MISVIIPTLNEKKNIFKISERLNKVKIISEVIFVDDNSTDGTFKEIKKIKLKKFKGLLRKSRKKDLSKSVVLGVTKAKNKVILVMDSDLQHDVSYIKNMWNNFNRDDYDLIVASRFLNKNFFGNIGFIRSFISISAISMINFLFGKKTSDPLSGFFMCKKILIDKYKSRFFLKGYKILFDVLYNGKKNLLTKDLSIHFKKRKFEQSKFNFYIIRLFLDQMIYTKFLDKK